MNISAWFIHSISVEALNGVDGSGDPSYSAAASVACRVEDTTKMIKNAVGVEVMASKWIVTETEIGTDDRITIAGSSKTYTPIAVKHATTKTGAAKTYEVWL